MKILFIADRPDAYIHGIWFHRIHQPAKALEMRGHSVKQMSIGTFTPEQMEWADVVVFGRTYPQQYDPIKLMREFKKLGKRVVYDMDDDFWQVAKDNPSRLVSNALKDQYEGMIQEADAIITPSTVLAKKFKKYFKKKIHICPNGVDLNEYVERTHMDKPLTIGYMGAASHWKDLQLIGKVISDLSKKHQFIFTIYGLTGEPIESAMYFYKKTLQNNFAPEKNDYYKSALEFYSQLNGTTLYHIPFMPPELHPKSLSGADFDIALAPLEDTVFNSGKSCIKFYECACVGSAVVASDVMPYKDEVDYRAKNTYKDWYNKIEKLIIDGDFRVNLAKKQQEWVHKNRSLTAIGLPWEMALQREGIKGLTSAMQE